MATNSRIFVDKTEMIARLNAMLGTPQRFACVSRPRRFGKTIAADMISAYYDREANSRALFEGSKLSRAEPLDGAKQAMPWDAYLGAFDVIYLTMTDFMNASRSIDQGVKLITRRIMGDLEEAYPDVKYDPDDLYYSMDRFYKHSKRAFVIVIDEWDSVFRQYKEDKEGQTTYLNFLRDWMKDKPYIALAYMTGILPIKKYGEHSALNMFTEYSMTSPKDLAEYFGFTAEDVREICERERMNYDLVREWYDGYRLSNKTSDGLVPGTAEDEGQRVYELYCPLSVVSASLYKRLENYWNKTETYEALAEYIRRDYDGLKDAVALLMDGGRVAVDTSTYQNDMTTLHGRDDVLSLLIHLGYLGYDDETAEVFIPNKEILDEFRTSTKGREWAETFGAYEASEELLEATWAMDADRVAELAERAHDKADNKTYNDEAALSYAIRLAYFAAQKYYTVIPEMDTGKGYADLVMIPQPRHADKPALVVELKYDQAAGGAIAQIRRREYPSRLEHFRGSTLLVGISYERGLRSNDPGFKRHTCIIEKA